MKSRPTRLRVGFLGVGSVAKYHAEVLLALGHAISTGSGKSADSPRWREFKSVAPQACFETDWRSVLEDPAIDAVVACLPWNVTETWLPYLLMTPKPLLLEKPIALSASVLSEVIGQTTDTLQNKYVGFNRRFYRTVQTLKDRVNQGGLTSVEITISETVEALVKTYGEQIIEHLLAYSSSHILDAAFHILGPLKPIRIYGHNDTDNVPKFASFSGLLETGHGAPVFLTVLADNPAPVGIRIFFDDQTTWHISPMERLIAYRGYDRTEPNTDSKIRSYTPKPFLEIDEDAEFKPGFLEQMRTFTEGSGRTISASPEESLELLSFIETVQSMAAGEERVPASPVGSSHGGDNTGD